MSAASVTTGDLVAWIRAFRDAVQQHKDELTRLDSEIGDADHGSNMARGLDAVVAKLDPEPSTPTDLFKTVGMTLVSTVGGASGPLYGTLFLRMGPALAEADPVDAAALGAALRAGVEGVIARGKAEVGDKTMIDALSPALEAWTPRRGTTRHLPPPRAPPPRPPRADVMRQSRSWPARAARATSASAVPDTSTRAPPRRRCCSRL